MVKNLVIGILSAALLVSLIVPLLPPPVEDPATATVANPSIPGHPETLEVPMPPPEPPPPPNPLVEGLAQIFEAATAHPGLEGAAIGFCLIGPRGDVVFSREAATAQIPASSLKTLTTATALEVLGPDFVFETRLGVGAPKQEGASATTPTADLILLGGGDPMLSIGDFEQWAKGLVEAGVNVIPGRVIGDGRVFSGSLFPDFWNWGDIGNGYGSPVSGLNLGHNRFSAVFTSGDAAGEPAKFRGAFPEVPGVTWWNETITSEAESGDGIVIHGGERTGVIHLRGTVPLGGDLEVMGAVPDPERFAAHHLRAALVAAGVEVAGSAVGAVELSQKGEEIPTISGTLVTHRSPPLLEIIKSIHENSDNHETECVFRTLGIRAGLPPEEVIRRHWRQKGLDLSGLRMVDGSGLARADHITPESLAKLQYFAANSPTGESYVGSLLETGDGRIRFKAGAMSAVRSYAGLVERDTGRHAFALMVNHYPDGAAVNELQREVFEILLGSEAPRPEAAEPKEIESPPTPPPAEEAAAVDPPGPP